MELDVPKDEPEQLPDHDANASCCPLPVETGVVTLNVAQKVI